MSLQGNLDPSFLSGLFQIFCDEKKTGLFKAVHKETQVEIILQEGTIAHTACFDGKHRLSEMLIQRGIVPADKMEEAVGAALETGKAIARSVLDLGYLGENQLALFIRELTQTVLLDLFQKTSGNFEYHDISLNKANLVLVNVNIRRAILETFRMLDELKEFKRRLPSDEITFAICKENQGRSGFQIDAVAWQILSLVHGALPIRKIVQKSTYNSHSVYAQLIALMDARMIKPVSEWEDEIHQIASTEAANVAEKSTPPGKKQKEKGLFGLFKRKR